MCWGNTDWRGAGVRVVVDYKYDAFFVCFLDRGRMVVTIIIYMPVLMCEGVLRCTCILAICCGAFNDVGNLVLRCLFRELRHPEPKRTPYAVRCLVTVMEITWVLLCLMYSTSCVVFLGVMH